MPTEMLSQLVLVLQLASTLYMLGLVWFVQWVHYPLFAEIGESRFTDYAQAHVVRTTHVVGPPMLVEAATALALLVWRPVNVPSLAPWVGVGLLGVIWLSTWLLQVPRHDDLARGFDARAHRQLVTTNWIRTIAWSLRAMLVSWMVLLVVAGAPT